MVENAASFKEHFSIQLAQECLKKWTEHLDCYVICLKIRKKRHPYLEHILSRGWENYTPSNAQKW